MLPDSAQKALKQEHKMKMLKWKQQNSELVASMPQRREKKNRNRDIFYF